MASVTSPGSNASFDGVGIGHVRRDDFDRRVGLRPDVFGDRLQLLRAPGRDSNVGTVLGEDARDLGTDA